MKRNWLKKMGIIPKYTEVSLFLISLTFLLLLTIDASFRKELFNLIFGEIDEVTLLAPPLILAGLILSTYHVFSRRLITKTEKQIMLAFAVSINFLAGTSAGIYILKQSKGLWIIFPILNIVSAFLLAILFRAEIIREDSILDKQAKKLEIFLGVILVSIIFFVSHFVFKNYWAITFSISTSYATNLNEIISKRFSFGRI
jgi:uncharacterized membrane protein YhdT